MSGTPTPTPTDNLDTALGADANVERVYDNVQSQLPAIAVAAIKLALWNTIEDFCLQSAILREHVFWQIGGGQSDVNLDPFDANRRVAWVLGYSGLPRSRVIPPGLLRDLTWPTPATVRQGEAWLALKPVSFEAAQTCGVVPELWSTWFNAMLCGTLWRLHAQPSKPWTSAQLSIANARLYRRDIAIARDTARRGFSSGGPVPFPYFADGRRRSSGEFSVR